MPMKLKSTLKQACVAAAAPSVVDVQDVLQCKLSSIRSAIAGKLPTDAPSQRLFDEEEAGDNDCWGGDIAMEAADECRVLDTHEGRFCGFVQDSRGGGSFGGGGSGGSW